MKDSILTSSRLLMSSVQRAFAPSTRFARTKFPLLIFLVTILTHLTVLPIAARSQTPFYQGKTIKIVVAATPGGTGDFRVRALAPFLRKYIPGNPTVILEFMDGSGGRKAANYMYANARPDGLTFGSLAAA